MSYEQVYPLKLGKGRLLGEVVECPFHSGWFVVRSGKVVRLPATEDIPTFAMQIEKIFRWQCCQRHTEPLSIYL
jgi:nitrite reductase/ring-hydroxylating ferredoxin subunit